MMNPQQLEQRAADQARSKSMAHRDGGPARRLEVHQAHLMANKPDAGPYAASTSSMGYLGAIHRWLTHLTLRLPLPSVGRTRRTERWSTVRD
jgi:hypothetical protein